MRLLAFIGLTLIGLFLPAWLFFACAILYAFWRPAYELIVLGVFIDAQFGTGVTAIPYLYTLSLGLVLLCAELAKPYLVFYRA